MTMLKTRKRVLSPELLNTRTAVFQKLRKETAENFIKHARETMRPLTYEQHAAIWNAADGKLALRAFHQSQPSSAASLHLQAIDLAAIARRDDIPKKRGASYARDLPRWFRLRFEKVLGNYDHWFQKVYVRPGTVAAWLRAEKPAGKRSITLPTQAGDEHYVLSRVFCLEPHYPCRQENLTEHVKWIRETIAPARELAHALHCRLKFSHFSNYSFKNFRVLFWPFNSYVANPDENLWRFRPRYDLRACNCDLCQPPRQWAIDYAREEALRYKRLSRLSREVLDEIHAIPNWTAKLFEFGPENLYGPRLWSKQLRNPPYSSVLTE